MDTYVINEYNIFIDIVLVSGKDYSDNRKRLDNYIN